MWLIVLIIIAAAFLFFWRTKLSRPVPATVSPSSQKGTNVQNDFDGFDSWLSILSKDKKNVKKFDLFGTRAAILWNDDDEEIYIVCITSFNHKVPQSDKYDYFWFNLSKWYWSGKAPRGCADKIKEEIKSTFQRTS